MIFIIPSNFYKMTSSEKLIKLILSNGQITDIIFLDNEKLFEGAAVDVSIFRYQKLNPTELKLRNINIDKILVPNNDFFSFLTTNQKLSDLFYIKVGCVSGQKNIFKNEQFGNVSIYTDFDHFDRYIMIDSFPSEKKNIDDYLLLYKSELMNRKIIKMTEKNWFKFGRIVKYPKIEEDINCIYIRTITRKLDIAKVDKLNIFGAKLIAIIPKNNDIQNTTLDNMVRYFNSDQFRKQYTKAGKFIITQNNIKNITFNF